MRLQLPDPGVRGGQVPKGRRHVSGDHPARSTAHRGISADLFDEDLDGVADRLDAAIKSAADRLHILVAGHRSELRLRSRGGGIRTHDLFVPNEARYQAAPHPA